MGKALMLGVLKKVISFYFVIFVSVYSSSAFALSLEEIFVLKEGKFDGFTSEGKELIKSSRDILLKRKEYFSEKFKQFESIYGWFW